MLCASGTSFQAIRRAAGSADLLQARRFYIWSVYWFLSWPGRRKTRSSLHRRSRSFRLPAERRYGRHLPRFLPAARQSVLQAQSEPRRFRRLSGDRGKRCHTGLQYRGSDRSVCRLQNREPQDRCILQEDPSDSDHPALQQWPEDCPQHGQRALSLLHPCKWS